MFIHYLKIAFRNIRKYALQNAVSIVGLATGVVAFALSSLWMGYVDTYDSYHKDADRIYTFSFYEDGKTMVGRYGGRLAEGYVIDDLFRTYQERGRLDSLGLESIMYYHQESESRDNLKKTCLCIDSSFMDFFNPILVSGDWSFLDNPGKIAVSCSFAQKEYGDDNPIGKEIGFRSKMYTIGAVVEDFDHSFLEFEMLRKGDLLPHRGDEFLIIPVSEVSHITIRDGVVRICTLAGRYHTLNMTLEEVEGQLDPQRFMRVNRQSIISATAVQKLSTYFLGKMRIHMAAAPDEEIIVSKDKVATVKRWLDS